MALYPWYGLANPEDSLMQGDFLENIPIAVPLRGEEVISPDCDEISATILTYDVVIMSQSCDLVQRRIDSVLMCPVWSLTVFGQNDSSYAKKSGKEQLRKGQVNGYHLLNRCEDYSFFGNDFLVVDFRNACSAPLAFVESLSQLNGERLRLLPPYREHLSQAFARFFMRVGLPADIASFK